MAGGVPDNQLAISKKVKGIIIVTVQLPPRYRFVKIRTDIRKLLIKIRGICPAQLLFLHDILRVWKFAHSSRMIEVKMRQDHILDVLGLYPYLLKVIDDVIVL